MTFTVERRLYSGLHLQTYYTFARDIGDLENGETTEDAYNRQRERAAWGDLPAHRFNTNFVYDLPFGKGKQWASGMGRVTNAVLGNWIVSGIYTRESGGFITPLWSGPDPTGTLYFERYSPHRDTASVSFARLQDRHSDGAALV